MTLLVLSDRPVEGLNVNGKKINYKCYMTFLETLFLPISEQ